MAERRVLALLGSLLLWTGCQSLPPRDGPPAQSPPRPDAPAPSAGAADATAPADEAVAPADAPVQAPADTTTTEAARAEDDWIVDPDAGAGAADVWQRLRARLRLPGCDYLPESAGWMRRYAAAPRRFAQTLADLLPALAYTLERIEARDMPGEFALLPIVESHYRPFPGTPQQPAGIWQMVGPTARSAGARIDAGFDARLNLAASTEAALALIERYGESFDHDWRIVAMAYASGEHRLRRALQRHQPDDSAASLAGLGLSRSAHDYLAKLLALSCLVREPGRHDLELPALPPERRLAAVRVEGSIGGNLLRALSGLDAASYDRFNAGLRHGRTSPGQSHVLLVRAQRAPRVEGWLAAIPPALRLDWQHVAADDAAVAATARRTGLDPAVLAAINEPASDAVAAPSRTAWLPSRPGERATVTATDAATREGVHVVRSGESLWLIARRHGLTVAELLRYNRLQSTRLMPGQRLQLSAP